MNSTSILAHLLLPLALSIAAIGCGTLETDGAETGSCTIVRDGNKTSGMIEGDQCCSSFNADDCVAMEGTSTTSSPAIAIPL